MNKIEQIRNMLPEYDIDALLITSPVNRRYISGFPSSAGMALITRESAHFYTDSRYIEAAKNTIVNFSVEIVDSKTTYSDRINMLIDSYSIKTLGIEEDTLSYSDFLKHSEKLKTELKPAQDILNSLRRCKSPEEIEKLRSAQRLAEEAYKQILTFIRPGVTEKEIAAELTYRMLLLGADSISFEPIVVCGEKTSMPHGVPGSTVIRTGCFVTMDFGCRLDGYCSDMTRTVAIGNVTDEMRDVYDTVLKAQLAGIAAAKAGVKCTDVDAAARELIAAAGYEGFFGHGFGHGLGLAVHESPSASQISKETLAVGDVISAEPGIYIPGKFGVRIEDIIVIRENDIDNLMKAPKELIVL